MEFITPSSKAVAYFDYFNTPNLNTLTALSTFLSTDYTMSHNLRLERVNALPAELTASTMYFVKSATSGLVDIYVTGTSASEVRHVISKTEIQSMITQSVSDFTNIRVLADIAARDAIVSDRNVLALVLDATADTTVSAGAALYVYDAESAVKAWSKVSEFESLDVVLEWDAIQNKPTSTVAAIDDAVAKTHVHANKAIIDKIGEDADGNMIYNGAAIQATFAVVEW